MYVPASSWHCKCFKNALNSNKHVRHSIWDGKGHKQCCITNKKLKVKTTPGFTLFYARFIHKHHLHFVSFLRSSDIMHIIIALMLLVYHIKHCLQHIKSASIVVCNVLEQMHITLTWISPIPDTSWMVEQLHSHEHCCIT